MTDKKLVQEVLGKVTIDAAESAKTLQGISELIDHIKAQLKELTSKAGKLALNLGTKDADKEMKALNLQIRQMKTALSQLGTTKNSQKIFESGDLTMLRK